MGSDPTWGNVLYRIQKPYLSSEYNYIHREIGYQKVPYHGPLIYKSSVYIECKNDLTL